LKAKCVLVTLSLLLVISLPPAVSASLTIDLDVGISELVPLMDQTITAKTNERGVGILFVLQPAEGTPWEEFLDDHPILKVLFNKLPTNIKTKVTDAIGEKIVSVKTVNFGTGGGSETLVFPDDFLGINGDASTELVGEYTIFFAYMSWEGDQIEGQRCSLAEKEFDCKFGSFNVIPEVPLGTIMIISSMGLATLGYIQIKKPRKNKTE